MAADWQPARLIPTSGIGSTKEEEARATSALLSVLTIVRPLSKSLLDPLGASRARAANVEAFIEVQFDYDGKTSRPDGLLRVSHGTKSPWTALVEVKTGNTLLDVDQIKSYLAIARDQGFDAVITISNEIAPAAGVHPTKGLKVRANSRVAVHHWSWSSILTEAIRERSHRGVDDAEQEWILGELIRYLRHPKSGALTFADMGPEWTEVRDGAREARLSRRSDAVGAICHRWDQLVHYAALTLSADIGQNVQQVISRAHRKDQRKRAAHLAATLCDDGVLAGALRVPDTAGDLELVADLRGQRIQATLTVEAPEDRQNKARITWLARQLPEAPGSIIVESWTKNARNASARATLAELREDPALLSGPGGKDISRFTICRSREMGQRRKSVARTKGFIDSMLGLVTDTYADVVQEIQPWAPKTPKIKRTEPAPEPEPVPLPPPEPEPAMSTAPLAEPASPSLDQPTPPTAPWRPRAPTEDAEPD